MELCNFKSVFGLYENAEKYRYNNISSSAKNMGLCQYYCTLQTWYVWMINSNR